MNYDMNALYLYNNGYRYEVGSIAKVNEKTIRMTSNTKINKEDFEAKTHKLTEIEASKYRGELIKRLSVSQDQIWKTIRGITQLKYALKLTELVQVNTKELQATLDNLEKLIKEEMPQPMNIGGIDYKFTDYTTDLEEVQCTI